MRGVGFTPAGWCVALTTCPFATAACAAVTAAGSEIGMGLAELSATLCLFSRPTGRMASSFLRGCRVIPYPTY